MPAPAGDPSRVATSAPAPALWDRDPSAIAAGLDGNMWFTEPGADRIGRITPDGTITEFPAGAARFGGPQSITVGPDGHLWFTASGCSPRCGRQPAIGRISVDGTVQLFPAPAGGMIAPETPGEPYPSAIGGITAGPDGNMWFTMTLPGRVVRITPTGTMTVFPVGSKVFSPRFREPGGIATGPDGNLWFTVSGGTLDGTRIVRMTPMGSIREFTVPRSGLRVLSVGLTGITAGPDGNIWAVDSEESLVVRFTLDGAATWFSPGLRPTAESAPSALTLGPDKKLWFAAHYWTSTSSHGGFGSITPSGQIAAFPADGLTRAVLPPGVDAGAIAWGPDGSLWFTEVHGWYESLPAHRIGRIDPDGAVTEFPPTPRLAGVSQQGRHAVTVALTCPSGPVGPCEGLLSLRTGRGDEGVTKRTLRVNLAAGERRTVALPLWAEARRRLITRGTFSVWVELQTGEEQQYATQGPWPAGIVRSITLRTSRARTSRPLPTLPGSWETLPAAPFPRTVGRSTAVWTGTRFVVFAELNSATGCTFEAASYDPPTGIWRTLMTRRVRFCAGEGHLSSVWTGKEMLITGIASLALNPRTGRWRPIPPRLNAGVGTVVWTGREMIGWGGGCCCDSSDSGAAYNPASRRWRALPTAPLRPMQGVGGVWTGREFLILGGGTCDGFIDDAAAYNPRTNTWRRLAPVPKWASGPVSTGRNVLTADLRFSYNPRTDRWRRRHPTRTPPGTAGDTWTGRRFFYWGGESQRSDGSRRVPRGLVYNPISRRWSQLPAAPVGGQGLAVWTGRRLIVWGSDVQLGGRVANGAIFTPDVP